MVTNNCLIFLIIYIASAIFSAFFLRLLRPDWYKSQHKESWYQSSFEYKIQASLLTLVIFIVIIVCLNVVFSKLFNN